MKKGYIFLLALLVVGIPGCGLWGRKKAKASRRSEVETKVDIPLAQDDVRNVFDENIGEFIERAQELPAEGNEYAWIEESGAGEGIFRKVYFAFDKHNIEASQEGTVDYDAQQMKKMLKKNPNTVFTVGGYCDERGNHSYNLALSEKRAVNLKKHLVAKGIPAHAIKVVGYGQENLLVRGGSIEHQAPNRRDEIYYVAQR